MEKVSSSRKINKLCLVPRVHGTGGMVSFKKKFSAGLMSRQIDVCSDLEETPYDGVLVIGGTRHIPQLRKVKKSGVPIIQRLNGMNWIHRKRYTGVKHFLKAEYGNFILSTIRSRVADGIVYQSQFSKDWWERVYGPTKVPNTVVHNGIDLNTFNPEGKHSRPKESIRVQLVEGNFGGGYEFGLETAVSLVNMLSKDFGLPAELAVAGKISTDLQMEWTERSSAPILWMGHVGQEQIPELNRSAHFLFAADINPACPNSVIEALACGLPVVAFDTGALKELVTDNSGQIVDYGGDPWNLDPPDIRSLAEVAIDVIDNNEKYREAARRKAEQNFGLDKMTEAYLAAFDG
jgi:glycosyltransferase involved in cell wall biosynthesis